MFKTNIKKTINIPERCKGGEEEIEKQFEFLVRMFLLYLDVSSPKIIYHFNAIPINNKVFFNPPGARQVNTTVHMEKQTH